MDRYLLMPVEEEGWLNDTALYENFFKRVYTYRQWKKVDHENSSVQELIKFHSTHKLMLKARGIHRYQELGRMVAGTTSKDLKQRRNQYIQRFMEVMKVTTRRGRQVNVLQHIMGYLKNSISSGHKQELLSVFESYRQGQIPFTHTLK